MSSSKSSLPWFHCGRCGSLFQSQAGEPDSRRCTICGQNPSHDEWHAAAVTALPTQRKKPSTEPAAESTTQQPKVRRRRKSQMVLWIVVPWLAFMVFLLTVARYFWQKPQTGQKTSQEVDMADVYLDEKFLKDNMADVYQTFAAYMVAGSNEQRSQFVADPIRVAPRMTRFFELNPLVRAEPDKLQPQPPVVLHLPQGRAIEMCWQSEGRLFETTFIQKDGEWRLDWEHFVRYSEFPFSLFLAGDGPDEAEFRLFARERLAAERRSDPHMSLVFYAPVPGKPRETGPQSPEILVPRHSAAGRHLTAAFELLRKVRKPFGSRLAQDDSNDLIRVRVRIRRSKVNDGKTFEITGLAACHWYGITDAAGMEIPQEDPAGGP